MEVSGAAPLDGGTLTNARRLDALAGLQLVSRSKRRHRFLGAKLLLSLRQSGGDGRA